MENFGLREFRKSSHAAYNAFIQQCQEVCLAYGVEYRVSMTGPKSQFKVYWDGGWYTMGEEVPFVAEAERHSAINEEGWAELAARIGAAAPPSPDQAGPVE